MAHFQNIKCFCGGTTIVLFYYWNKYKNTGRVVRMCENCGKDWIEYVGRQKTDEPFGI